MNKTQVNTFCFIILMATIVMFAGVAWAAPVPDTGQMKCYDVAGNVITCPSPGQALHGQDANYSINPMSFTKLDGSGNALLDSATSWVMVKDNVTGLVWEMKTNKDGVKNYNDPHDADNTYTWYDSNPDTNGGNAGTPGTGTDTEDFIKALNDALYGGYSDWRMPTIKELAYIVNYSIPYPVPTIDTGYFPNTAASRYWSSNTYADYTSSAWGADFDSGGIDVYSKLDSNYVRAVRGGQSGGALGYSAIRPFDTMGSGLSDDVSTATSAYADNGDGTVTDTSTGLMWQQQAGSSAQTWQQALAYCEGLNLGGHTDWRLPTIKELLSFVDHSRCKPAINTTYFPNAAASWCWSSTTYAGSTNGAWGVGFGDGSVGYYYKSESNDVRAVRGGQYSGCTATLDRNLMLHIPVLASLIDWWYAPAYWADFVYEYNPMYPVLIIFKMTNAAMLTTYGYECEKEKSTLSDDLKIHIPGLLLADGITHLSVDMEYSPAFSTNGNTCFVVVKYGVVPN